MQHQKLKALAIREPEVYYAVPAFIREEDFNSFFANGDVFTNTVFISLRDVPDLPDDDQHYITYTRSATISPSRFLFHSNHSQPFGHQIYGKEWLEHLRRLMHQPKQLGWSYLYLLREELLTIAESYDFQQGLFDRPTITGDEHIDVVQDLRRLLFAHFGVILIFLQPLTN